MKVVLEAITTRYHGGGQNLYIVRWTLHIADRCISVPMCWSPKDIRRQFPWYLQWLITHNACCRITNLFSTMMENVAHCLTDISE